MMIDNQLLAIGYTIYSKVNPGDKSLISIAEFIIFILMVIL